MKRLPVPIHPEWLIRSRILACEYIWIFLTQIYSKQYLFFSVQAVEQKDKLLKNTYYASYRVIDETPPYANPSRMINQVKNFGTGIYLNNFNSNIFKVLSCFSLKTVEPKVNLLKNTPLRLISGLDMKRLPCQSIPWVNYLRQGPLYSRALQS